MTTAAIARRAFASRLLSPATFRPALAASDHRTRAMGVVTDHNLGKNLDDAIHKAEKAREDIWFRDHDLDALRDLYKKARKQARHWKMEGESVKTDAAELAELKKLVNGKLDQATMERLIDWKAKLSTLNVVEVTGDSDDASDETGGEETSQLLPPVIVEPGQTEATAKVGDFIDIVVDEVLGTTISTDNSDVLEIYQARQDGDAIFNPGAKALAAGDATITVTLPDNTGYDIAVTVTE